MMSVKHNQAALFNYSINLEERVREDNPLRVIGRQIDFGWVRDEVAALYGHNGNQSVDPVVIIKLLFLLFWDNIKSERELMGIVPSAY